MAAPALHLTVSVPVAIELMPGWHEQFQPQGPFVVLADPAAIDPSASREAVTHPETVTREEAVHRDLQLRRRRRCRGLGFTRAGPQGCS
jgi:hypothetical protein